jgi:hypothetical protein
LNSSRVVFVVDATFCTPLLVGNRVIDPDRVPDQGDLMCF